MRNPWKKVMQNVKLSSRNGAAGGRTVTLLEKAGYTKSQIYGKIKGHIVEIDDVYLEDIFNKQNGKCYWLDTIINPMDVFTANHPLAPSVDRLDNKKGYIKDNVVITTRFANCGRRNTEDKFFSEHCLPRIKEGLSK
tara:strand:+ start:102 stop:512 length:411 start_codon:yes stop_codon:yes gene_type:complete